MGITICEIHGRVGFVETCSHIADQIENGTVPSGRRFTILANLFICDKCFHSSGFEQIISLKDLALEEQVKTDDGCWEAIEKAYESIERRSTFCLKCLAELEGQASI
jgi:hypothetical protein